MYKGERCARVSLSASYPWEKDETSRVSPRALADTRSIESSCAYIHARYTRGTYYVLMSVSRETACRAVDDRSVRTLVDLPRFFPSSSPDLARDEDNNEYTRVTMRHQSPISLPLRRVLATILARSFAKTNEPRELLRLLPPPRSPFPLHLRIRSSTSSCSSPVSPAALPPLLLRPLNPRPSM